MRLHSFFASSSEIMNPLSAITSSLESKSSVIPEHLLISLSDIDPQYSAETNETAPAGVIPNRPFQVV